MTSSSSNEVVVMRDPEKGYALCREFVTATILPRFRRAVVQMLTLPNHYIISALHETVISIENVIDKKIRKIMVGNNHSAEYLRTRVLHFAGNILFKSDIERKMKMLMSNAFKVSFLLYETLEEKDNEISVCHESVLVMLRETVMHLIDPNSFDVMSVVFQAHNQAVWHIIANMAKRKCAISTELISLSDNTKRCQRITDWTVIIGLSRLKPTKKTLQQAMEKCFITTLAEKIYNFVIVEYPQSSGVIDDLRCCMQNNGGFGRMLLMDTLTKDVEQRLLQVGVGTTEILEGYASAVECLRRLDPTCVIMQQICSIIRQYIKQRPDTVRCIITYITGEKREELSEQLAMRRTAFLDEEELVGVNDELVPERNWMDWLPDPPDANPCQSRRYRQNADVFNMLVSVYGSKEIFVKEYRELLAERLTKSWNRDPQFEQRYLELLKLRFSEGELQQCEVMLKDMRDSEHIDCLVDNLLPFPINARIISSFFWPKIENEEFTMPQALMIGLDEYARGFEAHKGSRKLEWMSAVGSIELEVELDDVKAVVAVSPAHAAVLSLFTKKETWTVDEMAAELKMDKRNVKKRLEWWQNSGVVYASAGESEAKTWHLASGTSKMERLQVEHDMEEDISDDDKNEDMEAVDALEQYWIYTKSFIANQEPVKAERLHTIFRMFASPGQHGPTLEDVVAFLQRKVKLNLLSCVNGLYKVVKDAPAQ
ncbi:Anaphase-promoting complex subunit 2-like [Brugia malayi]|uniref:Anaphase-promoting complex subunit 2 n=1 Tax=Brugia malayi TaxID=6279 RepID=A0A4E9F2C1_BRUMA|nr:Anaphase-promoting complex subunit 2-like [Brugia malayi]VIO90833.1 Anaphase-promoting complex subunit 2-like [Brugia malayi]